MRSDWLLKLGILSAIHLPALLWISRASFSSFFRKKEPFGVGYPLVWYMLNQLRTSVSVKSGRYLPRRFAASPLRRSANTQHYSPPLR